VTVDQAIAVLAQMSGAGHGARPLKLQIVEDGITYAEEIKHFDVARDYDGEPGMDGQAVNGLPPKRRVDGRSTQNLRRLRRLIPF
jgi:hypothetical protein